jgi:uncharacterized damage-inducible protein DinB
MADPHAPDTSNPAWSFVLMARYNRLANARLYDACARIGDSERRADRGAFFGSIHATLNHILVGDRLWFGRLSGRGAPDLALNQVLHDDFDALRAARAALDDEIAAFADGLTAAEIAGPFSYRNSAGEARTDPFATCLTQMFNHATHHRGQVHCLLTQAGVADPPVLDIHYVMKGM